MKKISGMTEEQTETVVSVVGSVVPDAEIIFFGSRADGTFRASSDLDIAINNCGKPLSLEQLGNIREMFAESGLPFRVDVVDYCSVSPEFTAIIDSYR